MSLIAKDDWKGPLNVTQLQGRLRELHNDVYACSDLDELHCCVESYKDALDQAWVDHEQWYISARQTITQRVSDLRKEKDHGFDYKRNW